MKLKDEAYGVAPDRTAKPCSSSLEISRPSMKTRPELGLSSAPTMLRSVLLPEPDAPTTATNSPGSTQKSTPRKAQVIMPLP